MSAAASAATPAPAAARSAITARNAGPCGGPALPLRKQGGHRFESVGTTEKRLLADLRGRLNDRFKRILPGR